MAPTSTSPVRAGAPAPAFSAPDQDGRVRTLAEFRGRTVVLYFYPKDDTPGCTVEACSFRDGWAKFRKAGIEVLGISPDGVASHAKFAAKHRLPFTLLADVPAKGGAPRLCAAYGTWQEKSMYGRKYMGVARTTFVVGPDGRVAARFDKVKPDGHADEVLAACAAIPSAACKTPARTAKATRTRAAAPREAAAAKVKAVPTSKAASKAEPAPRSKSASSASAKAPRSPRTRASTRRASTSTRASTRR